MSLLKNKVGKVINNLLLEVLKDKMHLKNQQLYLEKILNGLKMEMLYQH
jgi:hypothetical protein